MKNSLGNRHGLRYLGWWLYTLCRQSLEPDICTDDNPVGGNMRLCANLIVCLWICLFCGCAPTAEQARQEERQAKAAEAQKAQEAKEKEAFLKVKEIAQERFGKALEEDPFDVDEELKNLVFKEIGVDLDDVPEKRPTQQELDLALEQDAVAAADRVYGDAKKQEVEERAIRTYPLLKLNDEIKVSSRRGPVEGRIEEISDEGIRVGGIRIPYRDLIQPGLVSFSESENRKMRTFFFNSDFTYPRRDLILELQKQLKEAVYKRHGFIRIEEKDKDSGRKLVVYRFARDIAKRYAPQVETMRNAHLGRIRLRIEQELRDEGLLHTGE